MSQTVIGGTAALGVDLASGVSPTVQKRGRINPMDTRDEAVMDLLRDILEELREIRLFMNDNR
jgi:hypothetical protein